MLQLSGMIGAPNEVFMSVGKGDSVSKLNSFDDALLDAKVGNVSLIRVTSILPEKVKFVTQANLIPGSTTPAVYTRYTSQIRGTVIAAAIAVGRTIKGPTLITEFSGEVDKKVAEEIVTKQLLHMIQTRRLKPSGKPIIKSIEHEVIDIGTVVALVLYVK